MARLRSLTPRQATTIAGGLLVALGIGVALVIGSEAAAIALVGALGVGILLAIVQLRRRLHDVAERLMRLDRSHHDGRAQITKGIEDLARRVEFAERRMMGVLEQERLVAAQRHREAMQSAERERELNEKRHRDLELGLKHQRTKAKENLDSALSGSIREVDALFQLYRGISPRAPMPGSAGWAIDPTGILRLRHLIREMQPRFVLELGSGTSTVWLAYAMEETGSGRIISVEHDERYAAATQAHLEQHRLQTLAEVRLAPLIDLELPDHETPWYDPATLPTAEEIDLLVVDGPPKATGPASRYPAMPILAPHLGPDAVVAIDDADRKGETEIIERWLREWPEFSIRRDKICDTLEILVRDGENLQG